MFQVAEVIETKMAYKKGQKDSNGNTLPLGSIQVRLGSHSSLVGQVRNVYCRPMIFNRRMPLIGEQVIICSAPVHDHSSPTVKDTHFLYFTPYNATDDLVLHQLPQLWKRKAGGTGTAKNSGGKLADSKDVGYTFPTAPEKVDNLQPFEGDDIWEGRLGQSIRFGRTVKAVNSPGTGIYDEQPSWEGGSNNDPIMILRIKDGNGSFKRSSDSPTYFNSYTIEDASKDDSFIYLTTKQKITKLKVGFTKNKDVMKIPNYSSGPQIIIDSDRVVINAKKDKAFLISAVETVTTGKKVLFQSDKHKVDLDDLMDYINDMCKEMFNWATGQKQFSTSMGPTLIATNMSEVTTLHKSTFPQKFKMP